MDRRRELRDQYKERRLHGGVYAITNTQNGKYLIAHTADVASARNRFDFAVAIGSAVHPKLRADWAALGAGAFKLDVLEELEQGQDQTRAAFLDDLKALEQLRRAELDPSKEY
jgi:hypothetical protein